MIDMKVINIIWDVDNQEELKELPKEIEIPKHLKDIEVISDYISNSTGFCHKGFQLEREDD